ncbi:hypothetical protein HYQ44_014298 [Verticillium longisporum]|nr:hypothetical protein HYQ44_014298 [Verticillium longisporum]
MTQLTLCTDLIAYVEVVGHDKVDRRIADAHHGRRPWEVQSMQYMPQTEKRLRSTATRLRPVSQIAR